MCLCAACPPVPLTLVEGRTEYADRILDRHVASGRRPNGKDHLVSEREEEDVPHVVDDLVLRVVARLRLEPGGDKSPCEALLLHTDLDGADRRNVGEPERSRRIRRRRPLAVRKHDPDPRIRQRLSERIDHPARERAERAHVIPQTSGKMQDSKRPRSDIGGLRNRTAAGGATRRPAPGALGSVDDARNSGGRRRPAPRRRKISRPPARSRVRAVPDGSSPPRRRGPSGPDSSAGCGSSGPRGPRSA